MQGSVFFMHKKPHPSSSTGKATKPVFSCAQICLRALSCVCLCMSKDGGRSENKRIYEKRDGRWVRPFFQKDPVPLFKNNREMYGINLNEKRVMFLILETKTCLYFPWSSFLFLHNHNARRPDSLPNTFPNILSSVEQSRRGIYPWNSSPLPPTSKFICIRWWYQ